MTARPPGVRTRRISDNAAAGSAMLQWAAIGGPAWVTMSYDGKYAYPESGEIIDVATRKVIGQLRSKTTNSLGQLVDAPYTHSRFMLEVDVDTSAGAGDVVRVTNQFGIGRVR